MQTLHVDPSDSKVVLIARTAFPSYKGRTFQISPFRGPMRIDSYWSGGSHDTRLSDSTARPPRFRPTAPFTHGVPDVLDTLPAGFVLACHRIFCGKDMGVHLYVTESAARQFLPAPVELADDERIVLEYTASLKSSYAGIKNYRLHEARQDTGITGERWESAKTALIARKLLNKAGAITNAGRNGRQAVTS